MEAHLVVSNGPVYLLSDSQLLFAKGDQAFLPELVANHVSGKAAGAAYIGASNGDEPAFYDIFKAAMGTVGLNRTRLISQNFHEADRRFLANAELVLLAGGDVARGWEIMVSTGMVDALRNLLSNGTVVMGVSAGAVQLGQKGRRLGPNGGVSFFETLGVVPFYMDCHDEARDWQTLQAAVHSGQVGSGLGIPFGAGLMVEPGGGMLPLGKPIIRFDRVGGQSTLRQSKLQPGKHYHEIE